MRASGQRWIVFVGFRVGPGSGPGAEATLARLCLVGGFALFKDSVAQSVPASAQRVLALLALSRRSVQRSSVAARMSPNSSEERAAAGLRSTLWRLRRILPGIVGSVGDHLHLDPSIEIDLHLLNAKASRLRSGTSADDLGPEAVSVFLGDLLPDWYEDWVLVERERFRQIRLHALENLCRLFADAGRSAEAVDAGLAAVAGEPLRETAQQALISAYLAEGNRAEALRQFVSYRELLQRELRLEPGIDMTALLAQRSGPIGHDLHSIPR